MKFHVSGRVIVADIAALCQASKRLQRVITRQKEQQQAAGHWIGPVICTLDGSADAFEHMIIMIDMPDISRHIRQLADTANLDGLLQEVIAAAADWEAAGLMRSIDIALSELASEGRPLMLYRIDVSIHWAVLAERYQLRMLLRHLEHRLTRFCMDVSFSPAACHLPADTMRRISFAALHTIMDNVSKYTTSKSDREDRFVLNRLLRESHDHVDIPVASSRSGRPQ